MLRLGEIVKEFNLPVQSHISENVDEIKWVQAIFPEQKSYAEVQFYHKLNIKIYFWFCNELMGKNKV